VTTQQQANEALQALDDNRGSDWAVPRLKAFIAQHPDAPPGELTIFLFEDRNGTRYIYSDEAIAAISKPGEGDTIIATVRCNPDAPPAPVDAPLSPFDAHTCNEWADMATNGLQWLRNISGGISTVEEALLEMETNCRRIRALSDPPVDAPTACTGGGHWQCDLRDGHDGAHVTSHVFGVDAPAVGEDAVTTARKAYAKALGYRYFPDRTEYAFAMRAEQAEQQLAECRRDAERWRVMCVKIDQEANETLTNIFHDAVHMGSGALVIYCDAARAALLGAGK